MKKSYNHYLQVPMSWKNWNPLSNLLWSKQEVVLDSKKIYHRVQFLTQQQKVKKKYVIETLKEQSELYPQTIIDYQDKYECSFRFTFKSPKQNPLDPQLNKITVKEIITSVILSTEEQTKNFYESNVNGIELFLKDQQSLENDSCLELYNQNQIEDYDSSRVLEIIYIQKTFMERIAHKLKNGIKKIPSLLASLLQKLFGLILTLLGLNGGITTILWKAMPSSQILSFMAMIVAMFFPALGPLLGLTKFMW